MNNFNRMSTLWEDICSEQKEMESQIIDSSESDKAIRVRPRTLSIDPQSCSSGNISKT